jgi:hypothetical protein
MTSHLHLGSLSFDLMREVSPEEPLLLLISFALLNLLHLPYSIQDTVKSSTRFSNSSKTSRSPDCIACHYNQETTTCLTVPLFLLDQFRSWNYQMAQILR